MPTPQIKLILQETVKEVPKSISTEEPQKLPLKISVEEVPKSIVTEEPKNLPLKVSTIPVENTLFRKPINEIPQSQYTSQNSQEPDPPELPKKIPEFMQPRGSKIGKKISDFTTLMEESYHKYMKDTFKTLDEPYTEQVREFMKQHVKNELNNINLESITNTLPVNTMMKYIIQEVEIQDVLWLRIILTAIVFILLATIP